jgi:hypothetical protein
MSPPPARVIKSKVKPINGCNSKKLRVTLFYLATIGTLILATSFFVYAQIQNHIGHGQSATMELLRYIPFTPKQERIGGIHAAILKSHLTADHFARQARTPEEARKARENYFELSEFWKRQFANRRMQVEIITEEQLETELYRFKVSGFDQPIRMNIREQRTQPAAVWLPTDDLRTGLLRDDAAMAYGNYLGGRFVWFGFTAQGIPTIDDFWERFDTIIGNAINWTSRRSIADRLPWPDADHAVTFALRSGRDLNRSISLARHFIQRDIRPALVLDKNTLPVNELALRDIRDSVEFIPLMPVDAEVVREGLDNTFDQRLNRARNNFRDALSYNVRGFNLPIEPKRTGENSGFDRFQRMGYDYIWIGRNGRYSPDLPVIAHQPIFRRLISPVFIYQNSFLADWTITGAVCAALGTQCLQRLMQLQLLAHQAIKQANQGAEESQQSAACQKANQTSRSAPHGANKPANKNGDKKSAYPGDHGSRAEAGGNGIQNHRRWSARVRPRAAAGATAGAFLVCFLRRVTTGTQIRFVGTLPLIVGVFACGRILTQALLFETGKIFHISSQTQRSEGVNRIFTCPLSRGAIISTR